MLASLPEVERTKQLNQLNPETRAYLRYHWPFWARPNQLPPPGEWSTWLALAGRGFGKTEAGAQWIRQRVADGARSIALIAETQKDLEEVMVARLVAVHPPKEAPQVRYKPVRLVWPNGAVALGYNGTEPDQLRGPEFDTAWCDELAKYRYARETWDMLQFTMRKGNDPRVFVTTTPRPIPLLKALVKDKSTIVTSGSTFDNAVNLAPQFLARLRQQYEGTRLGRQELNAEILEEAEGALWNRDMIERARLAKPLPQMKRVVVAIDPAISAKAESNLTGIVAAGLGIDGCGYILADASGRYSPADWARKALALFDTLGADRIVAEGNQGGEMVRHTIQTERRSAPITIVHASRGKMARAEPIAALYEQGRVYHAQSFTDLEDQMCVWEPLGDMPSPDRLDAMVWALTALMLNAPPQATFGTWSTH